MSLTQLGTNSSEGVVAPGLHSEVVQSIGTTERQLTANESGTTIVMDASDQITVRLPTPVAGMKFKFKTSVSVTSSDTHKIITKTIASEFIVGGIDSSSTAVAEGGDSFVANGTTHVAIESNGSTTGGLVGQSFELEAISTTQWLVTGVLFGTGTLATPFATS
ncbi:MAG: hypothetical protein V3U84_10995 [Thiotrichaceae bacterium]